MGTDWQSNLSSWKNRRRRQSAATYERVEGSVDGAETKSKEQEEKKKPKTYSQIMAERDKRKSTGTLNFYPIEDDDEPSWLTDAKSSRNTKAEEPERAVEPEPVITQRSVRTEYRAPPISSRSKSLSSLKQRPSSVGSEKLSTFDIDDTAVATWAEEQSDEESDNSQKKADEEEANNTDTKPQRNIDTNQNNQEEQQQVNNRLNDKNERFSSWNRKTESSLLDKSSSVYKNDKMDSGKTTSNKVSGLLKSFEKKDEDAKVSYEKPSRSFQFSATSDSSRRSEGFRNQKSKSFDTGTAGLTFSASPVTTEKIKSPVNAKPPVNPALLRKDTSPKQEAPEVKNYIEKTIKINQKPKNSRGFGFTIAGGADRKQPLEVTKVNLGSAADVCELQVHDEIVSINRKDVKNLTYFQVNRLIEKGVEIGEIELQIQRKISEGDDIWDEDEEEDDDDAFQSNLFDTCIIDLLQSPLAFNTNIRSPHLEGHSKFAEGDTNFDKSKSDTTPDDDKMWIMDKLVNSSQPINHNSYGQTYNQEETANISTNRDEQVEVAKPQIEVAFSQQVSPPIRQEVIEDTEVIQKSVQSNQYSEPKMKLACSFVLCRLDNFYSISPKDQLLSWEAPIRDKQPPPAPAPAEDSSGFGPPAALLRWQRPRPRSEYNFSSKSVLDSSDDFKKRLSGTWQLGKPSSEPESSKLDVQFSSEQQQFETKSKQLQQQYDDDMKKVESGHQEQFDKNVEEAITLANSQELHSSNMEQPIRFQVSSQQQSELRIDPRNHYPSEQNLPQYNFHLNLGQSGNSEDMQRVDWINSNDKQYDNTSVRRSNSPHEHWLVEEAERRRLAESKGRPSRHSAHVPLSNYSGPIKPVSEGLSNRWRDDSNVPRQHTFDTSNTGLTKPRSLYHSSQHESQQFSAKHNVSMSQTLPPNFSFDSSLGRKDAPPPMAPPVAPKPMRSSPNPHSPSSPSSPANHAEQVTAVSGRQGCSHCGQELGFGAAMVIESLGLYYHVQCFRCCVCRTALGNGSQGADVRVRVNKLHCRNCYSNDEEGLKYSKV
ncbi:hypothetical protein KUTeg_024004 [Tegillarca granosa]|uniref:Uncharacterized protein n=1 Tax=Tegillarca granosa TaxID=220873 RepID=A0ABQ9DW33_TEGGR|nr:hypothetical protein KUTeg_024004 [Tegillarca granosa]